MRRALMVTCALAACATPSPDAQRAREAEVLAELSGALAVAGMSVPLPPRRCEEPRGAPRWDDEVGCLAGVVDDGRAGLTVYARALVHERLGSKPEAKADQRADELLDAYLRRDERFAELARAIERDFDARRAGAGRAPKAPAPKPPAVAVADTPAAASKDPARDATALDAGPAVDERDHDGDAGPAPDAGVALTVRDRLVGTWVVEMPGPVLNVYHLCADGRASVRPETSVAAIAELLADLPPTRGTWEVREGEPATVTFVWAGGEPLEGEIRALSAESVTIDYGDETITAARRSASASCE